MFRILVVEDDDSARFLMCEVLRRAGYEPCPAFRITRQAQRFRRQNFRNGWIMPLKRVQ